jgi:hypothetical protein
MHTNPLYVSDAGERLDEVRLELLAPATNSRLNTPMAARVPRGARQLAGRPVLTRTHQQHPSTPGDAMPTIIVQADTAHGHPRSLTLVERALPAHLHSDHYLQQLSRRLSWAVLDAENVEAGADEAMTPRPESVRSAVR